MTNSDIFIICFVLYGVYCLKNIKKDYEEYKKTNYYVELNILIRNIGVIVGSIVLILYKLAQCF